jgi:hypothetical protein
MSKDAEPRLTIAVRMTISEHAALEQWRISRPIPPSNSNALRELVKIALAAEAKKKK